MIPLENLLMLTGTTPNIGTTTAAFTIAIRLANATRTGKVGYVCLNLKSSKISRYLGEQHDSGLSLIRADLKSQSMTAERLRKQCIQLRNHPNLFILDGNIRREQAELYTPEDIEYLLHMASQSFDYCVIDCHAYWDNAATIIAALYSANRILVTTPHIDRFQDDYRAWVMNTASMFGLGMKDFKVLITQYGQADFEYTEKEIQQAMNMQICGTLSYDRMLAKALQDGQLHAWSLARHSYGNQIDSIIVRLAEQCQWDWLNPARPHTLLMKWRPRPGQPTKLKEVKT